MVYVTVKLLNDDILTNSGSIRLSGITAERLLETRYSPNQRSLLDEIRAYLSSKIYKLSSESNLEFFSLMPSKQGFVDLRYSAHGSPIFKSERLNGILAHNQTQFQQWINKLEPSIQVLSVGIDECVDSEKRCKDGGCRSSTLFSGQAALINANETALVGVHAIEVAECVCKSLQGLAFSELTSRPCSSPNYCLNGGFCTAHGSVQRCQCPRGFDGPRCQKTTRSFNSSGGFAWLPALPQCQNLVLSLELITTSPKGLIFYNGPIGVEQPNAKPNPSKYQQDFVALQLDAGRLVFQLRQGVNGRKMSFVFNNYNRSLNDGYWHRIDIYKSSFKYRITIDRCLDDGQSFAEPKVSHRSRLNSEPYTSFINGCEHEFQVQIHDLFINSNQYYPLQLGGVWDKSHLPKDFDYRGNFNGCVRNFKVNGELYDLQVDSPNSIGFHANSVDSCPRATRLCNPSNETNYCANGVCDANFFKSECVCKPGYRGRNCEAKALPFDFQTPGINRKAGSYLKYRYVYQSDNRNSAYDNYLKKFTKIQLLFRTRADTNSRAQTLFQITSPNRAHYVYLEVANSRLHFRLILKERYFLYLLSNLSLKEFCN